MQRMFEVSHGGEEALTWSGDEIPEGESGIVIGESRSLFQAEHVKVTDLASSLSQRTINRE